jgi:hypothetical protein
VLHSGIFGYINYLVEKDRKFIVNTLVNGKPALFHRQPRRSCGTGLTHAAPQASHV